MKRSEKHKKRVDDFLAKNGSSPSNLTSRQQDIIDSYVKSRRSTKYGIIMIVVLVLALAMTTFYGFRKLYKSTGFVNSKEIIFYAVVTETDDRILDPREVRDLSNQIIELSAINGVRLATTIFLFGIIITAVVQDREKRKIIDAFLPKTFDEGNDDEDVENEDK